MGDRIPGTYVYMTSVNFENYLKALEVSYMLRQVAAFASPVVTISSHGSHCSLEVSLSRLFLII
jgi:hypothetical protein